MEPQPIRTTHLSDALVTEILARLPLRTISRFKSISKPWKSILESPYFRRLFLSLHKNSSWSLFTWTGSEEIIGFYGCKTWALRKSLALCIPQLYPTGEFQRMAFSNGLVLIEESSQKACFVGNPVLQQWLKIPPLSIESSWFCLVTRVDDDDGVVSSFKVVKVSKLLMSHYVSHTLSVSVYSSDTGIWSFKLIHCPYQITNLSYMTLNGTVYFYFLSMPGVFVSHDFYSESDHFRVVHYPDYPTDNNPKFRRALTSSGGFVMYVRTLAQEEETVFKVWRLNNDESWQVLWEIGIPVIGNHVPLAMHPFDSGVVYLWSLQNRHLVSCNLRTRNNRILRDGYTYNNDDHEDCVVDYSGCDKRMDEKWKSRSSNWEDWLLFEVLYQFVLPRWMESMPCPPEVEMINTASLLSEITSMQETRMRNSGHDDYF